MLDKLKNIFNKTSAKISSLFSNKDVEQIKNDIESLLISSDISIKLVNELMAGIKDFSYIENVKSSISNAIYELVKGYHGVPNVSSGKKPAVIIVVGVNGSGKTTTIAKLANYYKKNGHTVRLAACDTFRAAASEQLKYWADKIGVEITVSNEKNADPASVAYKAFHDAVSCGQDILIIDTAGRMHSRDDLMAELSKISKVLHKIDQDIVIDKILVLDGIIGQSAIMQARHFIQNGANSLIITKLDGASKGGAIISIINEFKLPVSFVGIGEGLDDIHEFDPKVFAESFIK